MVAALRRVAGDAVADRVKWQFDPAIDRIVATWPANFAPKLGPALGMKGDHGFREHRPRVHRGRHAARRADGLCPGAAASHLTARRHTAVRVCRLHGRQRLERRAPGPRSPVSPRRTGSAGSAGRRIDRGRGRARAARSRAAARRDRAAPRRRASARAARRRASAPARRRRRRANPPAPGNTDRDTRRARASRHRRARARARSASQSTSPPFSTMVSAGKSRFNRCTTS